MTGDDDGIVSVPKILWNQVSSSVLWLVEIERGDSWAPLLGLKQKIKQNKDEIRKFSSLRSRNFLRVIEWIQNEASIQHTIRGKCGWTDILILDRLDHLITVDQLKCSDSWKPRGWGVPKMGWGNNNNNNKDAENLLSPAKSSQPLNNNNNRRILRVVKLVEIWCKVCTKTCMQSFQKILLVLKHSGNSLKFGHDSFSNGRTSTTSSSILASSWICWNKVRLIRFIPVTFVKFWNCQIPILNVPN